MNLDKRISQLERVKDPEAFTGFAFVIEESTEQRDNPKLFKKVRIPGNKFPIFNLERKEPLNPEFQ